MTIFCNQILTLYAILLQLTMQKGILGEMIKAISVPPISFAGHRVNISCWFDLNDIGLYSLKWYHNDAEFYRHIPTESIKPVNVKPGLKFNVHEILRSDKEVTLQLASLTSAATGEYKCEVIAEHPSFRTESKAHNMTVIEEPPIPPRIEGARESYEEADEVNLKCVPHQLRSKENNFSITWYIGGRPASREFVAPFKDSSSPSSAGLALNALAAQLAPSGSTVDVECHLKLGELDIKTSKSVRIRVRKSNYFANYWSGGSLDRLPGEMLCISLFLTLGWHLTFSLVWNNPIQIL